MGIVISTIPLKVTIIPEIVTLKGKYSLKSFPSWRKSIRLYRRVEAVVFRKSVVEALS